MTDITLFFVRHGETVLNKLNRTQGWIDSDLTVKGINQAKKTANLLEDTHFNAAFSSDLNRAVKTKEIILNSMHQSPENQREFKELREVNFGYFEGLNSDSIWSWIAAPYGKKSKQDIFEIGGSREVRFAMKKMDPTHQAESFDEVIKRIQRFFNLLKKYSNPGDNVLVISHGSIIRMLVDYLGFKTNNIYPENGSISRIVIPCNEIPEVLAYNEH